MKFGKTSNKNLHRKLFAFPFLAVNNLDFKKRRNPLKLHCAEQYVRTALIQAFSQ